ncbi:GW dipeptide domain-containing protein [Vagococcus fluvialis]|uniref:GW dipeptide domain-containing protein n=1 Tax=Vagococcus fluvialis TaxID=2738 RepID=UPI003B5C41ED
MKKGSVVLLIGMLVCPMTLTAAEVVTEPSRVKEESIISETIQSSEEHFKETMTSTSIENQGYTEAVQSSTSSEIEGIKTKEKELTDEELLKYMEELAMNATTPEEYQEVLEYLKQHTDYNQVEQEGYNDIQAFSSRATQKIGVAQFLGITKAQLLGELQKHEYDNFYLGTPFRGLWVPSVQCMSPNGAPNKYGPGFNCTGFVATAFQRAGGDLRRITNVANAWGDVCNAYNWRDALRPNTENYAFNSVNELLASGKAEKGDVIYFEPDYTKPGYDCHIGFFWGSRSNENLMWHSYDKNIKSNIKSATPFTKIYLFKLCNDKNAVEYDKQMNNERFIEKTNAAVYSRPYNTGDKSVDSMSGMYHNQVHVSREVKNGHGVWQKITYKKNNQTKKGWIRNTEMVDVINRKKESMKLALNSDKVYLYSDPYYPGIKIKETISNQKTLPVSVSEKATTGYGNWIKITENGSSGWAEESHFKKIVNQGMVNKIMTVNKGNGLIFDSPYTSPSETTTLGNTKKLHGQEINFVEEAYTGYGHWYRTEIGDTPGWIKEDDLGEFTKYESLSTKKIINVNYSEVYDTPFVVGKTKRIDTLNNMKTQVVSVNARAVTDKGTWYESTYYKNGQWKKGWINSTDLVDEIDKKAVKSRQTVAVKNGNLFDKPYIGPKDTETVGWTKDLYGQSVELDYVTTTGYGTWYRISKTETGENEGSWIKSVDLNNFSDYKVLDTKKIINVNYGEVYDTPFVVGKTKRIDTLNNMKTQVVSVNARAVTDKGIWYESTYYKNGQWKKGWINSTDLVDEIDKKAIKSRQTVAVKNGNLFDKPYIGPKDTETVGWTKDLYGQSVELDYVTTTGYGTWYRISKTESGENEGSWIKSVDLSK